MKDCLVVFLKMASYIFVGNVVGVIVSVVGMDKFFLIQPLVKLFVFEVGILFIFSLFFFVYEKINEKRKQSKRNVA